MTYRYALTVPNEENSRGLIGFFVLMPLEQAIAAAPVDPALLTEG